MFFAFVTYFNSYFTANVVVFHRVINEIKENFSVYLLLNLDPVGHSLINANFPPYFSILNLMLEGSDNILNKTL